jgi:hypothetical protein
MTHISLLPPSAPPGRKLDQDKLADFLEQFDAPHQAWMLKSPHFLYTNSTGALAYEDLKKHIDPDSFHNKLADLFVKAAPEICARIGEPFTLMEFGPGEETKESQQLIISAAAGPHGAADYFAVDCCENWVKIADTFMKLAARKTYAHHGYFEDAAGHVPPDFHPTRLAMINLTYMNFPPHDILGTLKRSVGEGGFILIAQELITPQNTIPVILEHYNTEYMQAIAFGPLRREQVNWTNVDYDLRFANQRVEAGYIFHEPFTFVSGGNTIDVEREGRVVTIRSERRTEEELKDDLRHDNEIETVLSFKEPGDDTVVKLLRVIAPQSALTP